MALLVALLCVVALASACGGGSEVSADLDEQPVPALPDGVVDTLGVVDIVEGEGEAAAAGDRVQVQYVGVLATDGTQFDASWDRGTPFDFVLGRGSVIQGWDEGVLGMQVGGRRQLTIPSTMGYGDRGSADGSIPAGSDLVFVVDLLSLTSTAAEVSALFPDDRGRPVAPTVGERITELRTETILTGSGQAAAEGDQLEVHYVGALADGEEFDASWNAGASTFPVTLGAGQVLEGWDRGLTGAQQGERRVLYIPAADGYGEQGSGPIPPDSDLVFVVDVVSVRSPSSIEDQPVPTFPDVAPGQLDVTVIRQGSGDRVELGDSALLHTALFVLSTETQIDSTWTSGFPIPLQAGGGRPFPGFDQALLGMQVGEVRQAVVPPNLAYGEAGVPPSVGPNEVIVAVIEVFEIT